jgi:hypothetical protein
MAGDHAVPVTGPVPQVGRVDATSGTPQDQRPEHGDVEPFVAESAVERLDIAIAPGLARWDKRQANTFAGHLTHRLASQLRAVVAPQHGRIPTVGSDAVQLIDEIVAGDRTCDQATKTLTGVLIHDGHDLDRAAVGGGVELEIHRPHPIGRVRDRRRDGGGTQPFTAVPLRHP